MLMASAVHAQHEGGAAGALNLPTGKQLMTPVPGDPQRTNSLPMSLAVSVMESQIPMVSPGYGLAPNDLPTLFAAGDGSFVASKSFGLDETFGPSSLVLADLNRDGRFNTNGYLVPVNPAGRNTVPAAEVTRIAA